MNDVNVNDIPCANLKKGTLKRLIGEVKRSRQMLESERDVYVCEAEVHARLRNVSKADILEGMAGSALITKLSPQFGLKALEPCDVSFGWDLSTPPGQKAWKESVLSQKPLVVVWVLIAQSGVFSTGT